MALHSEPRREGRPSPRDALKESVAYAARSKDGVVAALKDARAGRLHPPPREEHARRFVFGLTAPFTLLRVAWGDAPLRERMVHRLVPPLFCMVLVLLGGARSLLERVTEVRQDPAALTHLEQAQGEEEQEEGEAKATGASREAAATAALDARSKGLSTREIAKSAVVAAVHEHRSRPAKKASTSVLEAILDLVRSKVAQILAVLGVVEWVLVWIGREHHDAIALEVSSLAAIPAEPLPGAPRLRLDAGWLKLKAWRAGRFLIFLALGSPAAWLVAAIPKVGPPIAGAIELAWAAYWAGVFAIANSFEAWTTAPEDTAPWFVRALERAGTIPVLGWGPRLYARLLTFATRNVWPACLAFEAAPWESLGLALARALASIPGFYLVCRPMFAPAATRILLARRPATLADEASAAAATSTAASGPEPGAAGAAASG
jgi:hypothetical protein